MRNSMIKLKRENCAVLHLPLKRKWYDMIASGEKLEEYRDHSPYWTTRIMNAIRKDKKCVVAAFSLGRNMATMFFDVLVIKAVSGSDHPEWGEPKHLHWMILLGCRVKWSEKE